MAEVVAVLGLLSSIAQLLEYGGKLISRLNEINSSLEGLPESFTGICDQLPLLLLVVNHFHGQANRGELSPHTESLLIPVLEGLRRNILNLDSYVQRVLPAPRTSKFGKKWEAAKSSIKAVGLQKDVDEFKRITQEYLNTLQAFGQTQHSDTLRDLKILATNPLAHSGKQSTVEHPKPVWMVNYDEEEDFVGRNDIMTKIEKQMTEKNRRVALAGVAGVGKSRIAIQYAHRFRQQCPHDHVFWIHGGSRSRFETDYRKVARLLDIPGREDRNVDIGRLVADWFSDESNGSWLVILDNADDRDLWVGPSRTTHHKSSSTPLVKYLPRCTQGRLLITTRDRQLGDQLLERRQQSVQISTLGPEDARILLSAKLSGDQNLDDGDADELVKELDYLPLAISQAAAYLQQTELSVAEYLDLFRQGHASIPNLLEESIWDPSRDHESSHSVFQTWRLSFEQIERQNPPAAEMLYLMAVLDRQAISLEFLTQMSENKLEQKVSIAKLKAFSLIQEETSSTRYGLHRLVQLSTRRWLEDLGKLAHWQHIAVSVVARIYPEEVAFEQWQLVQDMSSHVQTVLAYDLLEKKALLSRARLLHSLGQYTMERGRPSAALTMLQESHSLRSKHLGNDDERTLETLGLIGIVHSRLRQTKEAIETLSRFHEATDRVLGPRHRLTLKAMTRLTAVYNRDQSRIREGKDLSLELLKITEEEFGPESEDAIRILVNLVYSYNRLGEWRNAEDVGLRALKLRRDKKGEGHPDTLTIMSTLAWTYHAQGRFEEAKDLESKAFSRRLEILGPDHDKTQQTMVNLARLQGHMKLWTEAEELQREVFAVKERTKGPHHDDTKRAKQYLDLLQTVLENPSSTEPVTNYLSKSLNRGAKGPNRRPRGNSHASHNGSRNHQTSRSSLDAPSGTFIPTHSRENSITSQGSFNGSWQGHHPASSHAVPNAARYPKITHQAALDNASRRFDALQAAEAALSAVDKRITAHGGASVASQDKADSVNSDTKTQLIAALEKAQEDYARAQKHVSKLSPTQSRSIPAQNSVSAGLVRAQISDPGGPRAQQKGPLAPQSQRRRASNDSMATLVEPNSC